MSYFHELSLIFFFKKINSMTSKKAWIVAADMGFGHQRAVYPLKDFAEEKIISVGSMEAASKAEKKLWKRTLGTYEFLSRVKSIPVIGNPIFGMLDAFLHIPSFYPIRNLSHTTFQVNLLESSIRKGLCAGMLEKVRTKELPIITSFFASAIAADMNLLHKIYCIICDADLNRVWVAKNPYESRIEYLAPCGKAVQRLKSYGVADERIHLTGFPLPIELLGDKNLATLKKDLAQRLFYLDPAGKFFARHGENVRHFLGEGNCKFRRERKLTITYAVGGAGAQKEIGGKIAKSLKQNLQANEIKLNLVAGTKELVRDYFLEIKEKINGNIEVVYSNNIDEYFDAFNKVLKETDILWTKPGELSFYTALGLPIVITNAIGSQEKFNQKWLYEIQAGIKQENPDYTAQWLFDYLKRGRFADAAWSGFLKARKLGTFKIIELVETGKIERETSPVLR